jgi:hypothetical protein
MSADHQTNDHLTVTRLSQGTMPQRAPIGNEATRFKKGAKRPANAGRRRGARNKVTLALKDAVIEACERLGEDGAGKDGLVGFLMKEATNENNAPFMMLVRAVLPLHVETSVAPRREYQTEEEVRQLCAEAGIPFESMIDLAVPIPQHMIDLTADSRSG